jgi:hypothetical protein
MECKKFLAKLEKSDINQRFAWGYAKLRAAACAALRKLHASVAKRGIAELSSKDHLRNS